MAEGALYVISGPSGAGKGTLVGRVLEEHPDYVLSISATTRAPRQGEVDGVHYHFMSVDEFEDVIVRRLANAAGEMEASSEYDYVIVNDDLERATKELSHVLES